MEQIVLPFGPDRRVNHRLGIERGDSRRAGPGIFRCLVSGEISGVKLAASGHYYFTLKDAEAQLRCVCFPLHGPVPEFKPQDGAAVLARGRIGRLRSAREYQLQVEALELHGLWSPPVRFRAAQEKAGGRGPVRAGRGSVRCRLIPPDRPRDLAPAAPSSPT